MELQFYLACSMKKNEINLNQTKRAVIKTRKIKNKIFIIYTIKKSLSLGVYRIVLFL